MSTLAILISLFMLMFLAYRGVSVLILAPIMAALAVLLSGDISLMLPIYTETFMGALGQYLLTFFPIFLLGAIFGQLIADSGAAGLPHQPHVHPHRRPGYGRHSSLPYRKYRRPVPGNRHHDFP